MRGWGAQAFRLVRVHATREAGGAANGSELYRHEQDRVYFADCLVQEKRAFLERVATKLPESCTMVIERQDLPARPGVLAPI